jgi:hypothetical protein
MPFYSLSPLVAEPNGPWPLVSWVTSAALGSFFFSKPFAPWLLWCGLSCFPSAQVSPKPLAPQLHCSHVCTLSSKAHLRRSCPSLAHTNTCTLILFYFIYLFFFFIIYLLIDYWFLKNFNFIHMCLHVDFNLHFSLHLRVYTVRILLALILVLGPSLFFFLKDNKNLYVFCW